MAMKQLQRLTKLGKKQMLFLNWFSKRNGQEQILSTNSHVSLNNLFFSETDPIQKKKHHVFSHLWILDFTQIYKFIYVYII